MECLEGGLGCLGMEDWATWRDGLEVGIGLGYVAWARSRCARSLASRSSLRSGAIGTGFKFKLVGRGEVLEVWALGKEKKRMEGGERCTRSL